MSESSTNTPYLIAIVVMVALAIFSIVAVTVIRPNDDNSAIIVLILGSIAPTTVALLAFMKAQETHLSVNSRLDEFIHNSNQVARAEAEETGRQKGRDEANLRNDAIQKDQNNR